MPLLQPIHRLPPRVRRFTLVLFWLEVALVAWAASFGGAFQGEVQHLLGFNDKALHVLAFATLGLTALLLWRPAWRNMAVLFAFAAAIELVQRLIPGRESSLADLAASTGGLLVSWALFHAAAAWRARSGAGA